MNSEGQLELGTRERVEKQSRLLRSLYQSELAKNPTSRATESSRSNLIALRHTIAQIYGNAEPSVVGEPPCFSFPYQRNPGMTTVAVTETLLAAAAI